MRNITLLLCLCISLFGFITPVKSVKIPAPAIDMVAKNNLIWVATAQGSILKMGAQGQLLETIYLPKKADAWDILTPQQALSVDLSPDHQTLAIGAEDGSVYLYHNRKIEKTLFNTRCVIKKIAFSSPTRIVIALLSNEIFLYDIPTKKVIWSLSAGTSPLSDMAMAPNLGVAAVAGEAGIITFFDPHKGKLIGTFKGGNVDNIYKLDFQNGYTFTAGQDRRAILYSPQGKIISRFDGTFLIYAVALSPQAKRGAIAIDEQNSLAFVDLLTRKVIAVGKGHKATLNRILFLNEKQIVSCGDENKILFWEIP